MKKTDCGENCSEKFYWNLFKDYDIQTNVQLKNFSTMRTGGVGKIVVFPKNYLEIAKILQICEENGFKFFILGNGSNVLFDDTGYDGVLISLRHIDKIRVCHKENNEKLRGQKDLITQYIETKDDNGVEKCYVWVGAGANLFVLNQKLAKLGLSGLEWSYGIPASLGGLVKMNGGCFGNEICEFVDEIAVLCAKKIRRLKKDELCFEYRNSNLENCVILSVKLALFREKTEKIEEKMKKYFDLKRKTQPCEYASLGSVFKVVQRKNPIHPAKIIDNMGLKGVKMNGAEISEKHAGFIINKGKATSEDVLKLVEFLEKELRSVGVFAKREIIVLKNSG